MNPEKLKIDIYPNKLETKTCKYCKLKPTHAVLEEGAMQPSIQHSNDPIQYIIVEPTYLCKTHYDSWKQVIKG